MLLVQLQRFKKDIHIVQIEFRSTKLYEGLGNISVLSMDTFTKVKECRSREQAGRQCSICAGPKILRQYEGGATN